MIDGKLYNPGVVRPLPLIGIPGTAAAVLLGLIAASSDMFAPDQHFSREEVVVGGLR